MLPRAPRRWRHLVIAGFLIACMYIGWPWVSFDRTTPVKVDLGLAYGLDHGLDHGLNHGHDHGHDNKVQVHRTGMDRLVNSSFNWGQLRLSFPVPYMAPLPTGTPRLQLPIQAGKSPDSGLIHAERLEWRRKAVRRAFKKGWHDHMNYTWRRRALTPDSDSGKLTIGGWAAGLIDSLDTLWIMELKDEFRDAVKAVARIDWAATNSSSCNIHEMTVRYLGGLLAAYDLSNEEVLLIKAVELGEMLYAGFDTPNHMPALWLDFEKAKRGRQVADYHQPSAAAGTLSLEFTRLSQITGNPKYHDAIKRVTGFLHQSQNRTKIPGIWPTYVNMHDGKVGNESSFSLGALAGSLYEYLPKMHALVGSLDPVYEKVAKQSLATIRKHLLFRPMLPGNDKILFPGTLHAMGNGSGILEPECQHLSCFAGGMFALSGQLFGIPEYVDLGARLTHGCMYASGAFSSGIMAESFHMFPCPSLRPCKWDEARWKKEVGNRTIMKGFKDSPVPRSYALRSEAIESIFVLQRITGFREYSDTAWTMYLSTQRLWASQERRHRHHGGIENTTTPSSPSHIDSSNEPFWMSETLKYFYLTFSPPDIISLDEYVLNARAHPLKRLKSANPSNATATNTTSTRRIQN